MSVLPYRFKRTLRDHRKSVVPDPERHFATANYRIAKGSFALEVPIFRDTANSPLASSHR
jgi:hypothetical protein